MLTVERVRELFDWDGEYLVRKQNPHRGKRIGVRFQHVGNNKYYCYVIVDKKQCLVHRLLWMWHKGEIPPGDIDHIDGNGRNNNLSNLRAVSHKDNQRNMKRSAKNTSGTMGVSKTGERWRAYITVDKKQRHLGHFDNKSDAIAARKAAEQKYGFHENHGTERPL